ncbi:MAG: hypothetical protein PHG02_07585 [Oscillospiraceae bacterium]|nr:hypothetical protein [Oscillospiraceae bacterium]
MKRIICILLLLFSLPMFTPMAAEKSDSAVEDYMVGLTTQAQSFLDEQPFSVEDLKTMTLPDIVKELWSLFKDQLKQPIKMFARITAVLVLAAVLRAMKSDKGDMGITNAVDITLILAVFILTCQPMLSLFDEVQQQLLVCKNFILSFVPIYASVILSCGQIGTAAIYSGFFFSSVMIIISVLTGAIAPLIEVYLAFSVSAALTTALNLQALAKLVSKVIKWILTLVATVFCAIISLQSVISNAADSVALRAGKFLVGSGVPVIGRAVSDAVSTVYAGLNLAKGTIGFAGIIAVLLIFLPVLLKCCAFYFMVLCADGVAQATDNIATSKVLQSFAETISIYLSVLTLFLIIILFSTTLMLVLSSGG